MSIITTHRLILRQWKESDFEPFAQLNADPRVREFFPSTETKEQSDAGARKLMQGIEERGWGFWAVELKSTGDFIGFVGMQPVSWEAPFTPAVEIGWRLAHHAWGHGYATEAAQAVLKFGFEQLGLEEIVSFTVPANKASRNVMEKLGMTHDVAGDFNHPRLPEGHPLCWHVLYRLKKVDWIKKQSSPE